MVGWCRVSVQYQYVLLTWTIVRQGPTAIVVGADGGVWTVFSHLLFLTTFSLSLGDSPI